MKIYKSILAFFTAIGIFSLSFSWIFASIQPIYWPNDDRWLEDILVDDIVWEIVTWKIVWNDKRDIVLALNPTLWKWCADNERILWYEWNWDIVCVEWENWICWIANWTTVWVAPLNPDLCFVWTSSIVESTDITYVWTCRWSNWWRTSWQCSSGKEL